MFKHGSKKSKLYTCIMYNTDASNLSWPKGYGGIMQIILHFRSAKWNFQLK